MKGKIAKILGVAITAIMLVGIIPFAAPAMAGVQEWTDWGNDIQLPSEDNLVLAPNLVKGGPMSQAVDGKVYAYAQFKDDKNKTYHTIIVTEDKGRTWTRIDCEVADTSTSSYAPLDKPITEIVCSPKANEPETIFIAVEGILYRSENSGKNFEALVWTSAGYTITAMDVGVYDGKHHVVVGVNSFSDVAAGSAVTMNEGVYWWIEKESSNTFTAVSTPTSYGAYDILAVRVAPTFGVDKAMAAIGVGSEVLEYDNTTNPPTPTITDEGVVIVKSTANGGVWGLCARFSASTLATKYAPNGADIAFPSDYNNGTPYPDGRKDANFVFCIDDTDIGGIYRVEKANTYTKINRFNNTAPATDKKWNNLSMNGSWTNHTVLAGSSDGKVVKSNNVNDTNTNNDNKVAWTEQKLPRFVSTATAWVLLDKDFAINGVSYVLNVGGPGAGFNVAFGKTATYSQISLINDKINFIVDLAIATNGDIFIITTDSSNGTTSTGADCHNSLWRLLNGADNYWERVSVEVWASDYVYDRLALSPAYATDSTIYRWKLLGGNDDRAVQRSTANANAGSFAAVGTVGTHGVVGLNNITDVLPIDSNTVFVAGTFCGGGVTTTTTSSTTIILTSALTGNGIVRWTRSTGNNASWSPVGTTTVGLVTDLERDAKTGTVFAVGLRQNGTLSSTRVFVYTCDAPKAAVADYKWTLVGPEITVSSWFNLITNWFGANARSAVITPADDYATSGNVFVGVRSSNDNAGIYRLAIGSTATSWTKITANSTSVRDIVAAPGNGNTIEGTGMIYAIGANTASGTATYRVRGTQLSSEPIALYPPAGIGASAYSRLITVSPESGNVNLYATVGNQIWTYTDTLGQSGSGVQISGLAGNPVTMKASVTVTWDLMENAAGYTVWVSTVKQSNFYAAGNAESGKHHVEGDKNSLTLDNLSLNTKYYVSVWADAPVSSFMFTDTGIQFTTPPPPAIKDFGLAPYAGQQQVQTAPSFQWSDPDNTAEYFVVEVWTSSWQKVYTANVAAYPKAARYSEAWNSSKVETNTSGVASVLANNTSYYWTVYSYGATDSEPAFAGWSAFTTERAWATQLPPVTITNVPQPTINLSVPPLVTVTQVNPEYNWNISVTAPVNIGDVAVDPGPTAPTPFYIWVIVGIGAILTLAVIVLIIRTRRVV